MQIGVAGMASVGLPHILAAKAAAKAKNPKAAKDTSVILIWLDGGPGHMDMYDMKPEAPAEYRGLWSPIRTNVRGMEITEMYPRQAKVADKFSIVRSLYHGSGDHFAAAHLMLTSRSGASGADQVGKYPGVGAYAIKSAGPRKPGMPAYVSVPYASTVGRRPGYMGGNYLGRQNDPFETAGDPNSKNFRVRNLSFANGLSIGRLENRKALLKSFDTTRREVDRSGAMDSMDAFEKQAYEMVVGPAARKAFDISREDPKTRDMYGRNSWGQSTLLARRLVEAGTTFVTVHMGGWDHHWNLQAGMENYLPRVDAAVSGLFTDLHRRGLDEKVLVVLCGEFSRTPKMNNGSGKGTPGRDHWGNSML